MPSGNVFSTPRYVKVTLAVAVPMPDMAVMSHQRSITEVTDESAAARYMLVTGTTLLKPAQGVLSVERVARVEKRMLELPAVFAKVNGMYPSEADETPKG